MYCKKNVICADEVLLAVVSSLILVLDLGAEEEGQVENLSGDVRTEAISEE